jgi:hypothetical protein
MVEQIKEEDGIHEQWYIDAPARLVQYGNMLYPQYGRAFEKTISPSTWEWLQKKATEKLQEGTRVWHHEVVAHLESIVQGTVPFGYTIEEDLRCTRIA